jgi:outer membrane protein OmpA-like peptidoglycan-associated protein
VSADDVTFDLTERAAATEADAATLQVDLNALVTANPILFDQRSTQITADSAAIIDRVAAISNRVGGLAIEIRGHTDNDGAAATNQQLSEGRAEAVSASLVERGIAVGALTTAGFGGSQPIVDAAGVEDKAASRRVEFVVTVQ